MGGDDGKKRGPLAAFLKGTVTGLVEAVVCYPTELVKTTLQLQSKVNPQYSGMMDCTLKVYKANGIRGLYSGAMPLVVGSSAKQASRWTAFDTASNMLKDEKGELSMSGRIIAGGLAGVSEATLAVTPMETIKTRVADAQRKGSSEFKGSLAAITYILKKEGPMGLYRGVIPTILKQSTNQMVRFPVQHLTLQAMVGEDKEAAKSPIYNGLAGAMAGAVSVILTMPQDTVKTRMQSNDAARLYTGTLDCLMKIVRTEGPAFLYAGTGPRLVRVSLDVGITFTVYPFLSKYI